MKKYIIISATVAVALFLVIMFFVIRQWSAQGCGVYSLIAAAVFYALPIIMLWYLFYDAYRECNSNH